MKRKTISMPDAMGDWITDRVKSGQYNNESEYIRDLVRQDQDEQSQLAFLNKRIVAGEKQLASGEFTDFETPEDLKLYFDNIKLSIAK